MSCLNVSLLVSDKISVRVRVYPDFADSFETGKNNYKYIGQQNIILFFLGLMSVFDDKVLLMDPITLPIINKALV